MDSPVLARPSAMLLAGLLLLGGCGDAGKGPNTAPGSDSTLPDRSDAIVANSQERAQRLLDRAGTGFLESPSAHYRMDWRASGVTMWKAEGAFDLGAPVARQSLLVEGGEFESVQSAGHLWSRVIGEDVVEPFDECWMHWSTGSGDAGRAAALTPVGMMLLEPTAVGLLDGEGQDQVVVDLLLDEAAPAAVPKLTNQMPAPIDPTATVRGTLTLEDGRYAGLEYSVGDVVTALGDVGFPDDVLAEVADADLQVRIEYFRVGREVEVEAPAADEVVDLGSRTDFMAEPRGDGGVTPCAAAR